MKSLSGYSHIGLEAMLPFKILRKCTTFGGSETHSSPFLKSLIKHKLEVVDVKGEEKGCFCLLLVLVVHHIVNSVTPVQVLMDRAIWYMCCWEIAGTPGIVAVHVSWLGHQGFPSPSCCICSKSSLKFKQAFRIGSRRNAYIQNPESISSQLRNESCLFSKQ
ncbi:hypothetical protein H5410_059146, partial [Solanum commersonii]